MDIHEWINIKAKHGYKNENKVVIRQHRFLPRIVKTIVPPRTIRHMLFDSLNRIDRHVYLYKRFKRAPYKLEPVKDWRWRFPLKSRTK